MSRLSVITFSALCLLPLAAASSENYRYLCTQQTETRLIEVVYLLPDQTVPCEVRYQRNSDEPEVLWRANNQEGFCENKAQSLMHKQESWGFSCEGENLPEQTINSGLY